MRIVTLVLAAAAGSVLSPALAQTALDTAPPPQAQVQKSVPDASGTPAPPAKMQDQMPSEAHRENLALPSAPRGRYSFAPVDEGFLRFDHISGDVSLCRPQAGSWSCAAMPDNSVAQQQEIAELREQLAALKNEIAGLRESSPPRPPAALTPPNENNGSSVKIQLPTKDDIARTRAFIEDTWHRLVDMIVNLQKDVMRKS